MFSCFNSLVASSVGDGVAGAAGAWSDRLSFDEEVSLSPTDASADAAFADADGLARRRPEAAPAWNLLGGQQARCFYQR